MLDFCKLRHASSSLINQRIALPSHYSHPKPICSNEYRFTVNKTLFDCFRLSKKIGALKVTKRLTFKYARVRDLKNLIEKPNLLLQRLLLYEIQFLPYPVNQKVFLQRAIAKILICFNTCLHTIL
jgi:hypothetical protein